MFDSLFSSVLKASLSHQIVFIVLILLIGFFCLIKGSDYLVENSIYLAKKMKISPMFIGLTIVAVGTSLPEISVNIVSLIKNTEGVSVGNIIGSNFFNLLFILGLLGCFVKIEFKRKNILRSGLFLLISALSLSFFAVFFSFSGNYEFMWAEGIAMLVILSSYLIYSFLQEKSENENLKVDSETKKKNMFKIFSFIILGLAMVVLGGEFVTYGASYIAKGIGLSDFLIGLTVVTIGTSLPEIATTFKSIKIKNSSIAVGNIIGSNIFNILFIIGTSSIIKSISISSFMIIDCLITLFVFAMFFIFVCIRKKIDKPFAISMLVFYLFYFVFVILREFVW